MVDIVVAGSYDYYIYDLVPLGHALYYLSMASVYDEWIERITKLREDMRQYEEMAAAIQRDKPVEEDMILKELQYIKHRIGTSSSILTDREKTAFFFVIIPEEMILIDTQKAAQLFAKFNVPLSGYVVNRVIPESLATQDIPEYLKNRRLRRERSGVLGRQFEHAAQRRFLPIPLPSAAHYYRSYPPSSKCGSRRNPPTEGR